MKHRMRFSEYCYKLSLSEIRRAVAGLQDGDRSAVLIDLPFDVTGVVAIAAAVTAGAVVVRGRVAVDVDIDAVVPDGDVALRRAHAAFVPVAAGVASDAVARHAVGDGAAFVVVAEVVALGAAAKGKQGGEKEEFHGGGPRWLGVKYKGCPGESGTMRHTKGVFCG